MENENNVPLLNEVEVRVLGALIEKSKTTPDYYPMTVNALSAACNQKTSRNPVVEYSEETVLEALLNLKGRSLVSTAVGSGVRTIKYKHNFTTVYPLSDPELALLCLLFLRGAQTPGELNTNAGRLHSFVSIESVYENLKLLIDKKFVRELSKAPGQKENRFIHTLSPFEENTVSQNVSYESSAQRSNRVEELEQRVSELEMELKKVRTALEKLTGPI